MARDDKNGFGLTSTAALLLGWLAPGAGHILLGHWARGLVIFVAIGATFWGGMAMGGALTVDYRNERAWFAAQMLTGAHGLAGWKMSEAAYTRAISDPKTAQRYRDLMPSSKLTRAELQTQVVDEALAQTGLAIAPPADNLARAYSGIAGLLNVMCVFDAVMLTLLRRQPPPAEAQA
jgi:TM2 domain-containing membrane protein YozV